MTPRLHLGPRRVLPIARLASEHPGRVGRLLDEQLASPTPGPHDGLFVIGTGRAPRGELRKADRRLWEALGPEPLPAHAVLRSQMDRGALDRLVGRGLAMLSAFTPTDAAHVLGRHETWDTGAAQRAASILARRRTAAGVPVAPTPEAASELVHATLIRRSGEAVFDSVLAHDGIAATPAARNALTRAAFDGHRGAARIDLGLALPLIGLGAGAPLYYPGVAAMLGTPADLPAHGDVANAVGAVAGRIRITAQAVLTQPAEGVIRAHLPEGIEDFTRLSDARSVATARLRDHARRLAQAAGADEPELIDGWEEKTATVENRKVFIEAVMTVTATGRPRIAAG